MRQDFHTFSANFSFLDIYVGGKVTDNSRLFAQTHSLPDTKFAQTHGLARHRASRYQTMHSDIFMILARGNDNSFHLSSLQANRIIRHLSSAWAEWEIFKTPWTSREILDLSCLTVWRMLSPAKEQNIFWTLNQLLIWIFEFPPSQDQAGPSDSRGQMCKYTNTKTQRHKYKDAKTQIHKDTKTQATSRKDHLLQGDDIFSFEISIVSLDSIVSSLLKEIFQRLLTVFYTTRSIWIKISKY